MKRRNTSPTTARRAFTLGDFCDFYSIGRSTAYAMIRAGKLRSIKIGGRRMIRADDAELLFREPADA